MKLERRFKMTKNKTNHNNQKNIKFLAISKYAITSYNYILLKKGSFFKPPIVNYLLSLQYVPLIDLYSY